MRVLSELQLKFAWCYLFESKERFCKSDIRVAYNSSEFRLWGVNNCWLGLTGDGLTNHEPYGVPIPSRGVHPPLMGRTSQGSAYDCAAVPFDPMSGAQTPNRYNIGSARDTQSRSKCYPQRCAQLELSPSRRAPLGFWNRACTRRFRAPG
jgi:hypothetical protein